MSGDFDRGFASQGAFVKAEFNPCDEHIGHIWVTETARRLAALEIARGAWDKPEVPLLRGGNDKGEPLSYFLARHLATKLGKHNRAAFAAMANQAGDSAHVPPSKKTRFGARQACAEYLFYRRGLLHQYVDARGVQKKDLDVMKTLKQMFEHEDFHEWDMIAMIWYLHKFMLPLTKAGKCATSATQAKIFKAGLDYHRKVVADDGYCRGQVQAAARHARRQRALFEQTAAECSRLMAQRSGRAERQVEVSWKEKAAIRAELEVQFDAAEVANPTAAPVIPHDDVVERFRVGSQAFVDKAVEHASESSLRGEISMLMLVTGAEQHAIDQETTFGFVRADQEQTAAKKVETSEAKYRVMTGRGLRYGNVVKRCEWWSVSFERVMLRRGRGCKALSLTRSERAHLLKRYEDAKELMLATKRQAMTAERAVALDELIDQAGGPVADRETGENELVLAGVLCTHDMEPDLDKWAVAHFKRETKLRNDLLELGKTESLLKLYTRCNVQMDSRPGYGWRICEGGLRPALRVRLERILRAEALWCNGTARASLSRKAAGGLGADVAHTWVQLALEARVEAEGLAADDAQPSSADTDEDSGGEEDAGEDASWQAELDAASPTTAAGPAAEAGRQSTGYEFLDEVSTSEDEDEDGEAEAGGPREMETNDGMEQIDEAAGQIDEAVGQPARVGRPAGPQPRGPGGSQPAPKRARTGPAAPVAPPAPPAPPTTSRFGRVSKPAGRLVPEGNGKRAAFISS